MADSSAKEELLWELKRVNNNIEDIKSEIIRLGSKIERLKHEARRYEEEVYYYKSKYNHAEGRKADEYYDTYKQYEKKLKDAEHEIKAAIGKRDELKSDLRREEEKSQDMYAELRKMRENELIQSGRNEEMIKFTKMLMQMEMKGKGIGEDEEADVTADYTAEDILDSFVVVGNTGGNEKLVNEAYEKREQRLELMAEHSRLQEEVRGKEEQKSAAKQPGD